MTTLANQVEPHCSYAINALTQYTSILSTNKLQVWGNKFCGTLQKTTGANIVRQYTINVPLWHYSVLEEQQQQMYKVNA